MTDRPHAEPRAVTVDADLMDERTGYRFTFDGEPATLAIGSAIGHRLDAPVAIYDGELMLQTAGYAACIGPTLDTLTGQLAIRVAIYEKYADPRYSEDPGDFPEVDVVIADTVDGVVDVIRAHMNPSEIIDAGVGVLMHIPTRGAEKDLERVAKLLGGSPREWKRGLDERLSEVFADQ